MDEERKDQAKKSIEAQIDMKQWNYEQQLKNERKGSEYQKKGEMESVGSSMHYSPLRVREIRK